jgi:hypothetical protein
MIGATAQRGHRVTNAASVQGGTGDFSVSAWVRFDPAIDQDRMIVAHGNLAILGGKVIDLTYRPGRVNKRLVFRINDGASSEGVFLAAQQVMYLTAGTLADDQWHHVGVSEKSRSDGRH